VRHPFVSLVALTFLGLVCRQTDFAAIACWAARYWDDLRGPLGFTREAAPHATTLIRATARYSVDQFRTAFAGWLAHLAAEGAAAAVDGKTSKQSHDADGHPIHVLNVFAHDLKLALADRPVGGGKATEPEVLKAHLDELLALYPALRVLTGDALFCQRPLARAIIDSGRDSVPAIKDNQLDLHEAARTALAAAAPATAAATARGKKGAPWSSAGSGSTRRPPTTPARR
jgi:hypothetical protein